MDIAPTLRRGMVETALVALVLIAFAVGLVLQIAMVSQAAQEVGPAARSHFWRVAKVALVLLAVDLVALFWLGIRLLAGRFRGGPPHRKPLPYVDAWSVAGKRFQLDEQEETGEGPGDEKDPKQ